MTGAPPVFAVIKFGISGAIRALALAPDHQAISLVPS